MSGRAFFFWVAALLLLVAVVAVLGTRPGAKERSRLTLSSYETARTGARALYDLLEAGGVTVERWRRPIASLRTTRAISPGRRATLVLAADFAGLSAEEKDALWSWVEAGNTLVYVPTWQEHDLLEGQGLRASVSVQPLPVFLLGRSDEEVLVSFSPAECSPLAPYCRTVAFPEEGGSVDVSDGEAVTVHVGNATAARVVEVPRGRGKVYILADPFPATNEGLDKEDNAALAIGLLTDFGRAQQVYFDEFHHGFRRTRSLMHHLLSSPQAMAATAVAVLVLLLWIHARNREIRPAVTTRLPQRRRILEYVRSVAEVYRQARRPELALEGVYRRWRADLSWRLGVSAEATAEELGQAAARHSSREPHEVRNLVSRCERMLRPDHPPVTVSEVGELMNEITALREELLRGREG